MRESGEMELMNVLGTVGSVMNILIALAVLAIGFAVVRPVHQTAGMVLAGAGGARFVGVGLTMAVHAMMDTSGGFDSVMILSGVSTLIGLFTTVLFWGGILMAAWQMSEMKFKAGGT